MYELIKRFNDNKTHIEIDAVNQFENGTTDDKNLYTYSVLLIDNETKDEIARASLFDKFNKSDIKFALNYLEKYKEHWLETGEIL